MPGPRRRTLTSPLTAWLLLLATCAQAQMAWLEAPAAGVGTLSLGDTVSVQLHVDGQGHALTSIGLALSYDPNHLRILSADPEEATPFVVAGSLSGAVYTNDIVHAATDDARARIVVVTRQQADERQVISGHQELAEVHWQVVAASSRSRIRLVSGGPDGPVYTELGRPGREYSLPLVDSSIQLQLEGDGFVPLEDLTLRAVDAWSRPLSRIHPGSHLRWEVEHTAPHLVTATVRDGSLWIQARPRVSGSAQVTYRALSGEEVVLEGAFDVHVEAGPNLLEVAPLSLLEDGTGQLMPNPVKVAAPADHHLSVTPGPGLQVEETDAGWWVEAEADWSGPSYLDLRLLNASLRLIDSLQVVVNVQEVDDPPVLQPVVPLVALVGTESRGPLLSDLLTDSDDAIGDFAVVVSGDSIVSAFIEEDRLLLTGIRAGTGTLRLLVSKGEENWAWEIPVDVIGVAAELRFLEWTTPVLQVGEEQTWDWRLILDTPSPPAELDIEVRTSSNLTAAYGEEGFTLAADSPGDGWVRVRVSDPQGNTTSSVLPVLAEARSADEGSPGQDPVGNTDSVTEVDEETGDDGMPDAPVLDVEPPLTPVEPDPSAAPPLESIQLRLPSSLAVPAGEALELELTSYIDGVGSTDILWGVAQGQWIEASVNATGRLRLVAPIWAAGEDVIAVHLYAGQQQRTVDLRVQVEAAASRLHIGQIPAIHIVGGTTTQVPLTPFLGNAVGSVTWRVEAAQLVTVRIRQDTLFIEATGGQLGEEALNLWVADAETQAQRLVRIIVEPASEPVLQITAPSVIRMNPGDQRVWDLQDWITSGIVTRWESVEYDESMSIRMEDARLHLATSVDAPPGVYHVTLQAVNPTESVAVHFSVELTKPPVLDLAPSPVLRMQAGGHQALLDLASLVVDAAGEVVWELAGRSGLPAQIKEGTLYVDATEALPGRRVLRLHASTAARQQEIDIALLIEAPPVVVSASEVELTPGVIAGLSLDAGDDRELTWGAAVADAGITAVYDDDSRRLHLLATNPGSVRIDGYLPSGLQVATVRVEVRLLTDPVLPDPEQPPAPEPANEMAWTLIAPALPTVWPGERFSVAWASAIQGDILPEDLQWEGRILGGEGEVHAGVDSVRVTVQSTATLWLQAVDARGQSHSVVASVTVRPVPEPALAVVLSPDGIDVTVETPALEQTALRINGIPQRLIEQDPTELGALEGGGPRIGLTRLRLAPGIHDLTVAAVTVVGDVQRLARRQVKTLVAGATESRVELADQGVSLEIPVGSKGSALITEVPEGFRIELSPAVQQKGASLFFAETPSVEQAGGRGLEMPDPGGPMSDAARIAARSVVELQTDQGWVPVPCFRLASPAGVLTQIHRSGVYRLVATDNLHSEAVGSMRPLRGYPNPFNAEVTLQYVIPVAGAGEATLTLVDGLGRCVRQWRMHGRAGVGALIWDGLDGDGRPVASGVYLVVVQTPTHRASTKLLLLR